MRINIIHPSRSRPEQARKTGFAWWSSAKNTKNIRYILSVDTDDPCFSKYFFNTDSLSFVSGANKSAIEAINRAAANYTDGDLFVVISDDFNAPPFHWDAMLLEALEGKEDFLVKTQDGCQPWIITLPIMDRKYYERFGYIYDPRFSHLFCDTALTHIGHMLGKVIELPIMFKHNHYTQKGGQPKDAINEKNDKTWAQGEKLYLELLMRNFDLPPEQIVSNGNFDESHRRWLLSKGIRYEKL